MMTIIQNKLQRKIMKKKEVVNKRKRLKLMKSNYIIRNNKRNQDMYTSRNNKTKIIQMCKNHNRKAIRREFLFLKTQQLKQMSKMKIINKDSKIKSQEVGVGIKMIILNRMQARGKSDMFKSREMPLKALNLIKMDFNKSERVVISNKNLNSLIVVGKIEVDTSSVVDMKVVVEVTMIIIVTTNKKIIGK